jgi:HEPN domain-containing protein
MKKCDLVRVWFKYSYSDLFTARHMFEDVYPKQTEISCFHCQQCAEKAIKGFLIYKDIEPPKIHDLRILCKMCQDVDSSFNSISGACAALTPFAVAARYPKELAADETVAKLAIDKAQRVYDFCISKIPEMEKIGGEELGTDHD